MKDICECSDPGCPAHRGIDWCSQPMTQILFRIDMEDETGTAFCDACASDAYDSGCFTSESPRDRELDQADSQNETNVNRGN